VQTADFDADGDVDGADFLTWQRGLGVTSGATRAMGNADGDADVDAADLTIWKQQFGPTSSAAANLSSVSAIPEPSAAAIAVGAVAGMAGGALSLRRRRSQR
jgi:hypothetical protein